MMKSHSMVEMMYVFYVPPRMSSALYQLLKYTAMIKLKMRAISI